MSDIQVRGYIVSSSVNYLREKLGAEECKRLLAAASPELRQTVDTVTPAAWYPVALVSELNRAIVSNLGNNEDAKARDALVSCGKFMAREATNTFLRLLMRMLTPNLFAKKLPDLWKRDCTGGRLEVQADDQKLVCHIYDAEGYEHLAAVATGYATFALETMGKVLEKTTIHGWSVERPYQHGDWFELIWQK